MKRKKVNMVIKANTGTGGSMERQVESYKEAMEYVTQLGNDGLTVHEYTIVFDREAVELYEKPFQEIINHTFQAELSYFEMDRISEVWH